MTKRLIWMGSLLLILLVACGDNNEVQPTDEITGEPMNASDANPSTKYSFTKLELEADFEDINDTLEVEYENEQNDEMEASYQDKSQDIDLNGEVAMEELDRIFSSFTFDQNTTENEVLKTITNAFNIPKDAQKLELEIQFMNGTQKEYGT